MTQAEYINILRRNLRNLSSEEINEIIADVKEHYEIGLMNGKTEEEISALLGNPVEMAIQFSKDGSSQEKVIEDTEEYHKNRTETHENSSNQNSTLHTIVRVVAILFLVSMIFPVIVGVYAVLLSLYLVGGSMILVGIVGYCAIFGILAAQVTFIAGILIGTGGFIAGVSIIKMTTQLILLVNSWMKKGFEWAKGGLNYEFS